MHLWVVPAAVCDCCSGCVPDPITRLQSGTQHACTVWTLVSWSPMLKWSHIVCAQRVQAACSSYNAAKNNLFAEATAPAAAAAAAATADEQPAAPRASVRTRAARKKQAPQGAAEAEGDALPEDNGSKRTRKHKAADSKQQPAGAAAVDRQALQTVAVLSMSFPE